MSDKKSIALVDDDLNILTSLSIALKSEGYEVRTYEDGEKALKGIEQSVPDLAILDIKMPRMDGIELIKRLKKMHENLPVIFLTSKDDEHDEILGLRLGAEDYITKPFSQKLLIERIRVILRRQEKIADMVYPEDTADAAENIKIGKLFMDDARHEVYWQDKKVDLTVTEYLLVKSLAVNPGNVKTRNQIMDYAYSDDTYLEDRVIDSHIKRVRRKFRETDENFDQIETVYGMGYKYRP